MSRPLRPAAVREKRPVEILGDAGGGEVGVEVQLQFVMTGDGMLLAALLVQPKPSAATLQEVVPDPHSQNGADAGEGVDHGADERPIAQADQQGFLGFGAVAVLHGPDAVEQGAGFLCGQHRRLARLEGIFRAAHGVGRVELEDLAGDQPVKQNAKRRQVLLDGGRGQLALQVLNESGDVDRLHLGEPADAVILAPGRKAAGGIQVGAAGVGVVDLSGEELQHAPGGLGSGREKGSGGAVLWGSVGYSWRPPWGSAVGCDNVLYNTPVNPFSIAVNRPDPPPLRPRRRSLPGPPGSLLVGGVSGSPEQRATELWLELAVLHEQTKSRRSQINSATRT